MSVDLSSVLIERPDPEIAVLRLNRPDSLNALTPEMVRRIHEALAEVGADESCRAVILTGAGRAFCAGMDIKASVERNRGGKTGPVQKMKNQELFAGMAQRIRKLRQPVIAAVNGAAAGAGFALALASDIRFASPTAKFLIGAVRIGLTAGESGMSYHLPRLIGASRAFEIMLTGRPLLADEAERIGLVSRIVPDDKLFGAAMECARMIVANSPYSIKHTKQLMWTNLDAPSMDAALELENHMQILATMNEDFMEATVAFTEKRPPRFTGR